MIQRTETESQVRSFICCFSVTEGRTESLLEHLQEGRVKETQSSVMSMDSRHQRIQNRLVFTIISLCLNTFQPLKKGGCFA